MTATYTQPTDIQRILQTDYTFTTATIPTTAQLITDIEEAQGKIDRKTRHAWRETQVTNEFYDFPFIRTGQSWWRDGVPVKLRHRDLRTFTVSPASGMSADKIEIWDGSNYTDWVATKTQGRADDYWVDEEQGVLYIKNKFPYFRKRALRITYRYGAESVPDDIKNATTLMVVAKVVQNDDRSSILNEPGEGTVDPSTKIDQMLKEIDNVLINRTELYVV